MAAEKFYLNSQDRCSVHAGVQFHATAFNSNLLIKHFASIAQLTIAMC